MKTADETPRCVDMRTACICTYPQVRSEWKAAYSSANGTNSPAHALTHEAAANATGYLLILLGG